MEILLMEEILHHLGCIKPYEYWDIYYINWCRISTVCALSIRFWAKKLFFYQPNGAYVYPNIAVDNYPRVN